MTGPPGAGRAGERGSAARGQPSAHASIPDFAEQVLAVVEAIPPGRVMSYGDIAEHLGKGGPRQVGRVMALFGGAVAWWRVIHADGSFGPSHEQEALAHYREEGTPLRSGAGAGLRVDMALARWAGDG